MKIYIEDWEIGKVVEARDMDSPAACVADCQS